MIWKTGAVLLAMTLPQEASEAKAMLVFPPKPEVDKSTIAWVIAGTPVVIETFAEIVSALLTRLTQGLELQVATPLVQIKSQQNLTYINSLVNNLF